MLDGGYRKIQHADVLLGSRRRILITKAEKLQGKRRRIFINTAYFSDPEDFPDAGVVG